MEASELLRKVRKSGVIAVLRGLERAQLIPCARALRAGGIGVLEITLDTPGAIEMVELLRSELDGEAIVGAGTVLDGSAAQAAIAAGAEFIFSPVVDVDVIRIALRYGKVAVPGAMTPTEILTAASAGAQAVKLFPAGVLGPEYLRQVRAPLPQVPLVPTGGIDAENAGAFIRAGALAVGVGGRLVDRSAVARGEWEVLTARAERLVGAVAAARGGSA
ncbi:MAG TPA: bifunctional 4-hydroxy-2-oxoglutarate aldolase/2-dehydro-3-deoxy-phosphogluconate aldolase [Limnochordia bacterium]